MTEQIALTLPSAVLGKAEILVPGWPACRRVTCRNDRAIPATARRPARDEPLPDAWSDEETLANADLQMPAAEDERLSALLAQQQAATQTAAERSELAALMALYQRLLLRKAQGLREAVRRGLRGLIEP